MEYEEGQIFSRECDLVAYVKRVLTAGVVDTTFCMSCSGVYDVYISHLRLTPYGCLAKTSEPNNGVQQYLATSTYSLITTDHDR